MLRYPFEPLGRVAEMFSDYLADATGNAFEIVLGLPLEAISQLDGSRVATGRSYLMRTTSLMRTASPVNFFDPTHRGGLVAEPGGWSRNQDMTSPRCCHGWLILSERLITARSRDRLPSWGSARRTPFFREWPARRFPIKLRCRLAAPGGRTPAGLRTPLFELSRGTLPQSTRPITAAPPHDSKIVSIGREGVMSALTL